MRFYYRLLDYSLATGKSSRRGRKGVNFSEDRRLEYVSLSRSSIHVSLASQDCRRNLDLANPVVLSDGPQPNSPSRSTRNRNLLQCVSGQFLQICSLSASQRLRSPGSLGSKSRVNRARLGRSIVRGSMDCWRRCRSRHLLRLAAPHRPLELGAFWRSKRPEPRARALPWHRPIGHRNIAAGTVLFESRSVPATRAFRRIPGRFPGGAEGSPPFRPADRDARSHGCRFQPLR
jgi:hypothetical protein